ncbi:tetratricopeptide repeat protein 28-like [Acropora millepora]|uniref:tetratricopeptide repeat protein 28-like n=1 Tax=Acropora millepora TaxID=45264 RepID=UPI001CF50A8A|nr:tetratricopeptide repeat protein 28-like [Acropora millepora]
MVDQAVQGASYGNLEIGDRAVEGTGYGNLGNAYQSLGAYQKAIDYHEKCLKIAKEIGDRAGEEAGYGNLGNAYQSLGDYQKAMEYHEKCLKIAKEIGDRAGEGTGYGNLGNAYRSLGDYQKAIEYYENCLKIAKEIGDQAGEEAGYGNLGNAYQSLGDYQKAMEYHEKCLKIAKEIGDRAGEGTRYGNLGNAYQSLGDYQKAIEYYEKCLKIAKEIGDRAGEGGTYGNLGNAYQSLGDYQKAIEYHEKHLKIAKEIGDRAGEGQAHGNLGNAYQSLGDYQKAMEYHEKCLKIAKEIGDRAGEGAGYGNLGNAYQSLGDYKKAIDYHEKRLKIAKEIGDRAGEGAGYGNLGNAYQSLGDYQKAIEYYEKLLKIAKEIGDRAGEGRTYGNLGNAYQSLGDYQKAIEYHEKHLKIAKEIGDRAGEGAGYLNLGNAYQSLGDYQEAMEYHEKCLKIAKRIGDRHREGKAYHSIGSGFFFLEQFKNAADNFRCAVEAFNAVRSCLKSEDDWKINFREQYETTYFGLWKSLLRIEKLDEALLAAEQGRAQTLTDNLLIQYKLPASLLAATIDLKEIVSRLFTELSSPTLFLAVEGLSINIWLLSRGEKVIFRKGTLEGDRRETYPVRALLQNCLEKIQTEVSAVKCEDRTLDELPFDCQSSREGGEVKKTFQSLSNHFKAFYDGIIRPIVDVLELQDNGLVIVPDGELSFTPWAAVIESIRIRTVPSLTSYQLILSVPDGHHKKAGALLVGNPCLKELKKPLDNLPCAQEEVEMIASILNTRPLTGTQATKAEVIKRLSSVGLIHIAAHGNERTGEITLCPNPGWTSKFPRKKDFILTMSDVQAANLRARLVVLSCCHSGRGRISKGEGVVGIARAFLAAGARSVLVTLWAIDDEATMVFMKSFYQHLKEGKTASDAIHQSMKSLRESEEFSEMRYWAPFQLIGDDEKIEFEADDDVKE